MVIAPTLVYIADVNNDFWPFVCTLILVSSYREKERVLIYQIDGV